MIENFHILTVVLLFLLSTIFVLAISISFYNSLFNPIFIYVFAWAPLFFVNFSEWLKFHELSGEFLFLIFSSSLSFVCGCFSGYKLGLAQNNSQCIVQNYKLDSVKYRKYLILLSIISIISIIIFLISVAVQFDLEKLLFSPSTIRLAMSKKEFIDPSKFLQYTNIVLPTLIFIGLKHNVIISRKWFVIALLALLSNFLFTGRTRILWSLNWLAFTYIIHDEVTNNNKSYKKYTLYVILLILFNIISFMAIAWWLNKHLPNNPKSIEYKAFTVEIPEFIIPIASVIYYLGVNLPYMQNIIEEQQTTNNDLLLGNILLPYYKTLQLINSNITTPTEILEFKNVGLQSNTGTWLVQWWYDMNIYGILFFPFLIGLITNYLYAKIKLLCANPFILYFLGLLYTLIWFGFIGNKFLSSPTWIFVLLGILLNACCNKAKGHA